MKHKLKGNFKTKKVFLDNQKLLIGKSLLIHTHQSWFNWGSNQAKPGALQLSLAIMLTLTGSFEGYHRLKKEVIDALPPDDFEITFELYWKDAEISAREQCILNAHAHNKHLPYSWLLTKPNDYLICFVHPLEREQLAKVLNVWGSTS